jgi:hypothetical protein
MVHTTAANVILWSAGVLFVVLLTLSAYMVNTSLRLDEAHLVVTSMLGVKRRVARSDVRGLALRVTTTGLFSFPQRFAIVYGANGAVITKLPAEVWSERDLRELKRAIGPPEPFEFQQASPAEVGKEFPGGRGYLSWLVALATVVAIFGGTCLQMGRR